MNEEDDLTQEDVDEYNKRRQKEYDEATKGNKEIRRLREARRGIGAGGTQLELPDILEARSGARIGAGLTFEVGANSILDFFTPIPIAGQASQAVGSAAINAIAQVIRGGEFSLGEVLGSAVASQIPGLAQGKAITKAGSLAKAASTGAVSGAIEATSIAAVDEGRLPTAQEFGLGVGAGGVLGAGFQKVGDSLDPKVLGAFRDLRARINGSQTPFLQGSVGAAKINPKGSADPTGAGSERFLFGEDVFGNLPEANKKALAKLGITNNESKLLINRYNKIGRDSAGAVESVFTTYYDFEKTKSDVFPFFAKEMKNVTQTQTPQLDHVAQLVASLGFFDGQPVKYWPEIAKIVVNEGVFGLGHDPKNLKYLAFDVHTVKSNFWRDNIGDAGEKFFKGRDLSTLPKLKAAAKEYAAIIRKSNKLVETANAQYKLLNKTDISQAELEEFISRLGDNPLESRYNIKQVKAILKQMEDDGFLVNPKTTQAEETQVVKSEQKTAKDKKARQAKIDQEFQKSVVESETYRKYYASDPGKFKSPLVKGSKDDMLITHAEDIYEEMSVDKNPETKDAMIKKIMKIIKPRYQG